MSVVNRSTPVQASAGVEHPNPHRVERWRARGVLWDFSTLPRVRACGRVSVLPGGHVQVRAKDGMAGFGGLATCGSVWACPVCNSKIQAVRRFEVGLALELGISAGSVAFGAYTIRHHLGQPLDPLWRALSACWAAVGRDKTVKGVRRELGHLGFIRAAEVTHGGHGWHPHLHPLHFFASRVSASDIEALHGVQVRAWSAAANRLGLQAIVEDAQHLHLVTGPNAHADVGQYFAKVSWDMTSTQTKSETRAKASRTPWQLLHDVVDWGSADALDLWHHYERASKGKRALTWSRGLRDHFGLNVAPTDEDIAGEELGTHDDTGLIILDWSPIRRDPTLGALILDTLGPNANWSAVRYLLTSRGVAFTSSP